MTTRRTHALVAVLSFVAAAALGGCGNSGEDKPTTQAVDEYARTEAAKRSSSSRQAEPASTPAQPGTSAATSESAEDPSPSASASSTEPLANEPTDKAQVAAATRFVKSYLDAFNSAVREPATRATLDKYTSPECKSCAALKGVVDQLAKKRQRFDGDGLVWKSSTAETTDAPNTLELFVTMRQPPTKVLDEKGKVVNHLKRRDQMEKAFSVRASRGALKISAIKKSV